MRRKLRTRPRCVETIPFIINLHTYCADNFTDGESRLRDGGNEKKLPR